ncbi:hypothetical protein V5799_026900 [Amblyomma americanum]|uniref:Uncharacterized protein n=1 Tax=Amblyomma americanum TaxID=6943 RepID=A0AAQ4DH90_AMBAM
MRRGLHHTTVRLIDLTGFAFIFLLPAALQLNPAASIPQKALYELHTQGASTEPPGSSSCGTRTAKILDLRPFLAEPRRKKQKMKD